MTSHDDSRTVLVTGGNGRLGRLFVEDLRESGTRVVSLARTRPEGAHVDDVQVDLTDAPSVRNVVVAANAGVLVHLASVLRGTDVIRDNERIDTTVAAAVMEADIDHIVLASSGSVYGTRSMAARTEDSPLDASTPYARSKLRTESIFRDVLEYDGAGTLLALRIFNLSGPRFPDSLVQRLIRADAKHPVSVTGADTFVRDYMYQDDLVAILRKAIRLRRPGTQVVNVGTGYAVTTRELLTTLEIEPDAYVETSGEVNSSWADNSRMIQLFGVVPRPKPDRSWDSVSE
ncbi:NAD(P)-dependent oxidoreductase [Microbacterium sp. KRD172]|uniref:NAD-dependent epimerase/dehydratase family protein n=1 Tax=Microbacterium sp. KRD172 TaxID=2729727 RepID=UPI0019D2E7E6|nr:NAD-dependent epimerase/dehydratase family protein [Microbacterium sp. KRD172]